MLSSENSFERTYHQIHACEVHAVRPPTQAVALAHLRHHGCRSGDSICSVWIATRCRQIRRLDALGAHALLDRLDCSALVPIAYGCPLYRNSHYSYRILQAVSLAHCGCLSPDASRDSSTRPILLLSGHPRLLDRNFHRSSDRSPTLFRLRREELMPNAYPLACWSRRCSIKLLWSAQESPGSVNLPHRAECARLYGRIAGIASIALHAISKAPSH